MLGPPCPDWVDILISWIYLGLLSVDIVSVFLCLDLTSTLYLNKVYNFPDINVESFVSEKC